MEDPIVVHNKYIEEPGKYYIFEFRKHIFCGRLIAIEVAFNGKRTFTIMQLNENLYSVLRPMNEKPRTTDIKIESSITKFFEINPRDFIKDEDRWDELRRHHTGF